MSRPCGNNGEKNLIAARLADLRKQHHLSQHALSNELQQIGMHLDKNVITRIETGKRYVTDLELKALTQIFEVSYEYLIDGTGESLH